jgi:uncharacterized repeat protein (TIGR01451 family)
MMTPLTGGLRVALIGAAFLLASVAARPSQADTLSVDTTSDADLEVCSAAANDCSLRGAITLANSLGGSNTITFDSDVFNSGTITLTSALPNIIGTLMIDGPGASLVTVDGAGSYRVLYADTGSDLTLDGLTIANGGGANTGGAIFATGANLTVSNTTFSGNQPSANGGAINITGSSTAIVSNSTFSGNSGTNQGGAIRIAGASTLSLTDCTLTGNSAVSGGAIENFGVLTVNGGTMSGNTATNNGGGAIYANGIATTITGTTFDDNSALFGGAIAYVGGDLIVSSSTFTGNSASTASGGGGIVVQNPNSGDTVYVANSTFYGNTASSGGGFKTTVNTAIDMTIASSTFFGNTGRGLVKSGGTLTVNNSILAGNTDGDCSTSSGTTTIQYSLIEDGSCSIINGVDGNLSGDPMLGALADNGGPTQTMLLQASSPAIDTGNDALAVDANSDALVNDQRGSGYARIAGADVDMGAAEVRQTRLSLTVGANGSVGTATDGSLIGANIDACSNASCTARYDIESGAATLMLTAAPTIGYHLVGWTGDCAGAGTNLTAMVTMDVDRSCGATFAISAYTIGGTVSGLTGTGLVLQDNGGDDLSINADGPFTFSTPLDYNASYTVTVSAQPSAQVCTVSQASGTVGDANVTNVTVSCVATPPSLSVLNDDGLDYAQYGQVLDYTVTVSNSGATTATGVAISASFSAALDASSAHWVCVNATNGATCTASGSGGFSDAVELPGFSSVTYDVTVAVLSGTNASTATFGVGATGVSEFSDSDTLVLFRGGFESAAITEPTTIISGSMAEALLEGTQIDFVAVPPVAHAGIDVLYGINGEGALIRVQRLALAGTNYVRLLARNPVAQEFATSWSMAPVGTTLGIGSLADQAGHRIVLLDGAAQPIASPLVDRP